MISLFLEKPTAFYLGRDKAMRTEFDSFKELIKKAKNTDTKVALQFYIYA